MNVVKLIAPSAWVSYLINGDASGVLPCDVIQCDAWLTREGLPFPVSCDDAGFTWRHDAWRECPLGAHCQEYTFLTSNRKENDNE